MTPTATETAVVPVDGETGSSVTVEGSDVDATVDETGVDATIDADGN